MTVRVGINGFGRMGRLALRAAWQWPGLQFVRINEKAGDAKTAAHLLKYDSVHGTWAESTEALGSAISVNGQHIAYTQNTRIEATDWSDCDIVVECSGKFKSSESLAVYFEQGVKKLVVSAPVKSTSAKDAPLKDSVLNVVMGVNDHLYLADQHHIVSAASCTTNCIAPVVDVIHKEFGIKHGCITTIHDITNTQSILDEYHPDLRRARASSLSLIPTSTGSATAITEIFPELKGRLNGIAVRVPLANASLTDCVFELEINVSAEQVNNALKAAAQGRLKGVLGYEDLPLVSIDYTNDTRSSIIDAQSTMVINGSQLKILAWYDNEVAYVNRMMELVQKIAGSLDT